MELHIVFGIKNPKMSVWNCNPSLNIYSKAIINNVHPSKFIGAKNLIVAEMSKIEHS